MAGPPETPGSGMSPSEIKGSVPPANTLPKPISMVPKVDIGAGTVPPKMTLPPPPKPPAKPSK